MNQVVWGLELNQQPLNTPAENDKVSFASDIYSLGIILYELCTGQLPFTGSMTQVLGQIVNKEPAAPSSLNAEIAPKLEQIILKAISKRSEDRFQSMKEFATALKQYESRIQTGDYQKTIIAKKITSSSMSCKRYYCFTNPNFKHAKGRVLLSCLIKYIS